MTTKPRSFLNLRTILLSLLAVGVVVGGTIAVAQADRVHRKFKGEILLSDAPFPTSFDSDRDAIKKLRKYSTDEFKQDKNGRWNIEFWAFLKKPLEAHSAVIMFYKNKYREDEGSDEIYSTGVRPSDPSDNYIINYLTLTEKFFEPDYKYRMEIRRARNTKPLATATFTLEGNPEYQKKKAAEAKKKKKGKK